VEVINEKRVSARQSLFAKIVILLNSGENIVATTFNLSSCGVGMKSDLDIPIGTRIKAHIHYDSKISEVEGKIRWSSKNSEDDTFTYGIQFLQHPAVASLGLN